MYFSPFFTIGALIVAVLGLLSAGVIWLMSRLGWKVKFK